MIDECTAKNCIAWAREMKRSHPFFDVHGHPFELFYGIAPYIAHPAVDGVYTTDPLQFRVPEITELFSPDNTEARKIQRLFMRPGITLLNLVRLYKHTGPRFFEMHMDLCGIDKVLLLPVARPQDDVERQMRLMQAMFGGNNRFFFGWCVPASVPDDEISSAAEDAVLRFKIRAMKLHPNIMGINPQSAQGRRRIEAMLQTCSQLGLPLVVHGGKSPQLGECPASCYGSIANLRTIDWSAAKSPVVISHAGAYGCETVEIVETLLEVRRMLSSHSNLLVDISGLETENLALAVERLDHERIVFGSDMLYESPWAVTVKLLLALKRTEVCAEEMFIRIMSANPQKHLFPKSGHRGREKSLASVGN